MRLVLRSCGTKQCSCLWRAWKRTTGEQSKHKKSWRKEQQEKGALQARAVAEEQLLLTFFLGLWWEQGFLGWRRAGQCQDALPSMKAVSVFKSSCLRGGGGYHGGTRGRHRPSAHGEVVCRVWWSGSKAGQWLLAECSSRVSLQPDTLCQRKRRFWWSRHNLGERFLCMAALERSPLQQNSRKSLTEGHGLNVSPRRSGMLCPCCGRTGLPRADVHTTWETQRASGSSYQLSKRWQKAIWI